MLRIVKYLLAIFLFQFLFSCEKDALQEDPIIGTWISDDKLDTISFINDHIIKRSYSTFEYTRNFTRITIQYSGPCYIMVQPSTHHYVLTHNSLTIDFSNGCYGFNDEVMTYFKQIF
jgi:hypothetical protein